MGHRNCFFIKRLRLFPVATESGTPSLLRPSAVFAHFAPRYLVCFHANPNCPFRKSFVLITIQIAGGGGSTFPFHFSIFLLHPQVDGRPEIGRMARPWQNSLSWAQQVPLPDRNTWWRR